jgi:hypothetical protein
MAERAAHLIDHVFPDVTVRQWVLSLPHRLRYLLAWDNDLCRAVSGVAIRAVLGFLRRRACHEGVADGRSGAVVVVQRYIRFSISDACGPASKNPHRGRLRASAGETTTRAGSAECPWG